MANAISDDILDLMAGDDAAAIADPSGEPTTTHASAWTATFKRLRDGSWGARIVSMPTTDGREVRPQLGDSVECARRDGGTSMHSIIACNRTQTNGVYLAVISDTAPVNVRRQLPAFVKPAPMSRPTPKNAPTVKPSRLMPVPVSSGPELFGVRAAARRGDLIAGAAADGHGILTAFDGRGSMTRPEMLSYLAAAGLPADWCRAEITKHAHAGRVLDQLNRIGYICRADTKRRAEKTATNADGVALDLMIAADAREDGNNYESDAIMRQVRRSADVPTWAARWVVSAGRGRKAEIGASAGTVVMVATLDQNGNLHLECDNEALHRRIREDFDARVIAQEFAANDVTQWVHGILVEKFGAARLGGCWYIRHEHAAVAERFLTVLSLHWGCNWMLPALPIATTEQLCTGLANGLLVEAQAVSDEFAKLGPKATSKIAEGRYADVKALVVRAFGLATVIGDERVAHLVEQLGSVADTIAKSINRPMPPFASVARLMAPRR